MKFSRWATMLAGIGLLFAAGLKMGLDNPAWLLVPIAFGATFDVAAADAMLKTMFEETMYDSVVTHSSIEDIFEQNANVREGPQGRYIEGANMFGYTEGVGARTSNGFLPVPGNPTFANFRVRLKNNYLVVQMTHAVMKQAVKGKAAFADWAEVELTRGEKAFRGDMNRQRIGFGSGILCRVDEATPDATLQVDAPYGFANDTKGWLHLRRGMKIIFSANSDGSNPRANGESATILSVDKAGNSGGGIATLDHLPAGVLDNDYVFRGDDLDNSAPSEGVDVEMQGLEGMIDNGDVLPIFQNISREDFDEWKSQQIDASAAPYSGDAFDTLFMHMNDEVVEQGGSEGLTHILITRAGFRNVYKQLKSDGGFGATQNRGGLQSGTKGIMHWVGDRLVNIRAVAQLFPGRAFGLDKSTLRRYHQEGYEWDSTTGSIFRQVAVGAGIKDAFYAYGRHVGESGCTDPQKNIKVTGIDEAVA